jgi:hypothetical protein
MKQVPQFSVLPEFQNNQPDGTVYIKYENLWQ